MEVRSGSTTNGVYKEMEQLQPAPPSPERSREIQTRFKEKHLVTDAPCASCGQPMTPITRPFTFTIGGFSFVAHHVPAFRCESPDPEPACGGDSYPGEVSVDLYKKVAEALRSDGRPDLAAEVKKIRQPLAEHLKKQPSGLIKSTVPTGAR